MGRKDRWRTRLEEKDRECWRQEVVQKEEYKGSWLRYEGTRFYQVGNDVKSMDPGKAKGARDTGCIQQFLSNDHHCWCFHQWRKGIIFIDPGNAELSIMSSTRVCNT